MQRVDAVCIIFKGRLVRSNLVLTNISADDNTGFSSFESCHRIVYALVIETHAIDQRTVLRQTKQSWLVVSGLSFWGQCPDFDKTET